MDSTQRRLALAAIVVVAVAVIGGASTLGFGPLDPSSVGNGGIDASGDGSAGDGGGGSADGGGGASAADSAGTASDGASGGGGGAPPPFALSIVNIEECGQTCRDVTARLVNNQNHSATGVTVSTRIYAGNSTAEGDLVWEGQQDIGTMAPDSSVTRTQRVQLSMMEAFEVRQNDGWITVVTTVRSDDTTITFNDRRDVT